MSVHIVRPHRWLDFQTPSEFTGRSAGYSGEASSVRRAGSTQMGFRLSRLEPGGYVQTHLHSFEESIYVVKGSVVLELPEGAFLLTGR